jgi:hypothetical protein
MSIDELLAGKWVELLKEVAPRVSCLAVLWDPTRPAMRAILTETERATRALGLRVHLLEARDPYELERAFVHRGPGPTPRPPSSVPCACGVGGRADGPAPHLHPPPPLGRMTGHAAPTRAPGGS